MAKKIPVSSTHVPLQGGLGGFDFSALGELTSGNPTSPGPSDTDTNRGSDVKPGRIVLRREKSGRGGKVVVIVDGFHDGWTLDAIANLGKLARQSCGCGGTVVDRHIELQGDQPARVRQFFENKGFRVAGV
jgi:translation initiation factor 1